ncbi:DUF1461 domain-containing protein [Candidatus Woesearchaeota archaeon]|nr:DUF1461 domain-containing protein [Candidatus Woesearchaeota archaeon]
MPESLFLRISKFLMIIIVPSLVFLLIANFASFDSSFYRKEFLKYNVYKDVPQADFLHEKVIKFIDGKSNGMPNAFNQREMQHLEDVRKLIQVSKIVFCILVILFLLLAVLSALKLNAKRLIINFFGKVLAFGGILTIAMAVVLLLLVSLDFSIAFESFHLMFFEKGTYVFDSAKEIIVRLYPEQLFVDIGIRILAWVFILSVVVSLSGTFLIFRTKGKKNKNKKEWQF